MQLLALKFFPKHFRADLLSYKVKKFKILFYFVFSLGLTKLFGYVSLFTFYFIPFGLIIIFSIGIGIKINKARRKRKQKKGKCAAACLLTSSSEFNYFKVFK